MERPIELIKNRSDIGAGTRGADLGIDAMEIAAINKGSYFFKKYPHIDVPTRNESIYEIEGNTRAKHIKQIYQQCKDLSSIVENSLMGGNFPLVFSGDHSSAIGTVAGIRAKFPNKKLGIIWIDAHADIHSPYTTPSGNMHGMPIAAILGIDNTSAKKNDITPETHAYWEKLKAMVDQSTPIRKEHIVYFGVRDTEEEEDHLIDKLGIKNFRVEEVQKRGINSCLEECQTRLQDCEILYISFDVDSMDSDLVSEGTGTPVPKGFLPSEVQEIINSLLADKRVTCFEIVEVNPLLDKQGNKMAEIAFDILEQAFGLSKTK
ncbi:arginase [Sphingobacterium sp. DK4209]|uniref:Arginase n=1 Tax=Sphingobacterium zhuxiongii TaxID=2662364 RepID=A0A5Q0QDE1_9SPHI|nr:MULTISPECIES: arginase [unclassified Sphingobacterium]MVZ64393.1 arginase [Sphingobacterium sp. DK4209]QGA25738.1 arginase [Sphingobacterium sp. dk4302]